MPGIIKLIFYALIGGLLYMSYLCFVNREFELPLIPGFLVIPFKGTAALVLGIFCLLGALALTAAFIAMLYGKL